MSSALDRRAKAVKFVKDWSGTTDEQADSQVFHTSMLSIFKEYEPKDIIREKHLRLADGSPGRFDVMVPGKLLIEAKSAGEDLDKAYKRAVEYNGGLEEKVQYIMVDDFDNFRLYDLKNRKKYFFQFEAFPDKLHLFAFLHDDPVDVEEPIDIKVAYSMSRIFTYLQKTGYDTEAAGIFLVRLAFCMFADNTMIFDPGAFKKHLQNENPDGRNLGPSLSMVFQMLNTAKDKRPPGLHGGYDKFTYINGSLFKDAHEMPHFDKASLKLVIDAASHDWSKVSPSIFGTLFQGIMESAERRSTGAHYTTEENIMKIIRPLFLDELRAEFDKIRNDDSPRRIGLLQKLQTRLSKLKFLDPACGSGNFLIVAYREIRRLELDILLEINKDKRQTRLESSTVSIVDVDQFYGIETNGFAVNVAQVSLWMMDHLMNMELSDKFGPHNIRIPLKKSPLIIHADALDADWNDVLPGRECSYILSNPPFVGPSYMSDKQRTQIKSLYGPKGGNLDYVCGWYLKALEYANDDAVVAFVSTSSITQGQQVGILWPRVLDVMEIRFAYNAFKWDSEARGTAGVSVVIIGLGKKGTGGKKRLFRNIQDGVKEIHTPCITPYMTDSTALVIVTETRKQVCGFPKTISGSKPVDGGFYIFTEQQREKFLEKEPEAEPYMHQYVGADELIKNKKRWIFALHDISPKVLNRLPETKKRIEAVRRFRANSKKSGTRKIAEHPRRYEINVIPKNRFLVIPNTSSENRKYVPLEYVEPSAIPNNSTSLIEDCPLWLFGLISSGMHMAWLKIIGGRLDNRLRYSVNGVYNTFPFPELTEKSKDVLNTLAQGVFDARKLCSDMSFAEIYGANAMPYELSKAHAALDRKVERLYRKAPFISNDERVKFLLGRYHAVTKA